MKLRNKRTGEIEEFENISRVFKFIGNQNTYNSLAELNEEWEDYEESKEYWYIKPDGSIIQVHKPTYIIHLLDGLKSIGNYFETKEEAEKALEKLKAWKRLKDVGVSFKPATVGHKWYLEPHASPENRNFNESHDLFKDVMTIFGGEE